MSLTLDRSPSPSARLSTSERINRAKAAFTTRRVPLTEASALLTDRVPQPGDVVLARVTSLGQHHSLQLTTGRRAKLYIGDEVIVAYGNRYAPDQFEAWLPDSLGPCQLAVGAASRRRCGRGIAP